MKADVVLDNRNFTSNTTSLIDEGNPPNVVPVYIQVIESINLSEFESMISAVMTTGQLADGEYKLSIQDPHNQISLCLIPDQKQILWNHPPE